MVSRDLVLGIDLGSSGVKIVLMTSDGMLVGEGEHPITTTYPSPGFAEQDPHEWYDAVAKVIRTLVCEDDRAHRIVGIGLTGAAHIPVLLDSRLDVIRPAILWTDQRSQEQVAFLEAQHQDDIWNTTYNRPSCTWTLPQLMWLSQHEPHSIKRLSHLLLGKDYINYRFTGSLVADESNAASSMLMDVRHKAWSPELATLAGIQPSVLPPIHKSETVIGTVTSQAASETGLRAGTPVVAGALDSVTELFSLGLFGSGNAMVRMGTAGGVMVVSNEANPSPQGITYPYLDDKWCTQAFTNACATAMRWIADVLGKSQMAGMGHDAESVVDFAELDRMAEAIRPGSDGLIFHPYLMGERAPYWDPKLRASFVGLSVTHHQGHMVRSVHEGVAFSLRDCMELLLESGYAISKLHLTGGGAKSKLWRQIVADVLGAPMIRTSSSGSAHGVAMLAGVACGMFGSYEEAISACVHTEGEVTPNPNTRGQYDEMFRRYKELVGCIQPIYGKWNAD